MACNMIETNKGWAGVSCRSEFDWYVITLSGKILSDNLPNYEAAKQKLSEFALSSHQHD